MEEISLASKLDHLFRHEYSKLVALLTNKYSASLIDQVEDAVQEALYKASRVWAYQAMPDKPSAWLFRVANNHLIDQLRRNKRSVEWNGENNLVKAEVMVSDEGFDEEGIEDDQLKMIFACCHPSMKLQEQLMLSLKLLCGLSVKEIARALMKSEEATKKSIFRAKIKFKDEVGTLVVPSGPAIKERLAAVLQVIYLLFNEGYKATDGVQLIKHDICEEAIRLGLLLRNSGICDSGELHALLSMMFFKVARFPARVDGAGDLVTLEKQDRSLWNRQYITWGWQFLQESSKYPETTSYQLEAAIACYYSTAETFEKTNWKRILELYDALTLHKPSPVVKLSRAVVLSKVEGAVMALRELGALEPDLKSKQSFYAIRADLHAQVKDWNNARADLSTAIRLSDNQTERRFLEHRLRGWKNH